MTTRGISFAVLAAERASQARTAEVHWAQVGDRTVVWAPVEHAIAALGVAPDSAAGLSLVMQVGRSFQDEHPRVRVLVDHGRHLVVDAGTLPESLPTEDVCWRVEVLPQDTVVVDRPMVRPARRDSTVVDLLGQLVPSSLDSDLKELVGFGTRHSLSATFGEAAEWAANRLLSLGYTVAEQSVTVGLGQSRNVIADLPPNLRPSELQPRDHRRHALRVNESSSDIHRV